jgi:hypothetical protein
MRMLLKRSIIKMPNVFFYQRSKKRIARAIRSEKDKDREDQNPHKIEKLEKARADCSNRLAEAKRKYENDYKKARGTKKKK